MGWRRLGRLIRWGRPRPLNWAPRVTYPEPEPEPDRERPAAKVILRFQDGSELSITGDDPRIKDFVKAADRMMSPSRWRRLIKPGRW